MDGYIPIGWITNSTYIHTGGTLRSSGTGWIRSDLIHGMGRFAAFGVSVLVFGVRTYVPNCGLVLFGLGCIVGHGMNEK